MAGSAELELVVRRAWLAPLARAVARWPLVLNLLLWLMPVDVLGAQGQRVRRLRLRWEDAKRAGAAG
jgi:hypothetical protein